MLWISKQTFFSRYLPMLLSTILIAGGAFTYIILKHDTPAAEAVNCGSGYTYCQQITIDHTQAGASDSTNFTLEASTTQASLATVANGGHVQNTTTMTGGSYTGSVPADLVVTSDSGCGTKLNWEFESYSATTGSMIFWFQVPTLSHTADTTVWVCYGNSSVTTWQGNVSGTWDSNYAIVYHMPDGATLNANDSTSNANNGSVTSVTATSGQIDGAGSFNGTSGTMVSGGTVTLGASTHVTFEAWLNDTAIDGTFRQAIRQQKDSDSTNNHHFLTANSSNKICFTVSGSSSAYGNANCPSVTSGFHLIVGTWDGTNIHMYKDAVASTAYADTATADVATINVGSTGGGGQFWSGTIDEIRVSTTDRSADWITAEYNNTKSGSTMMAFGSELVSNSTHVKIRGGGGGVKTPSFVQACSGGTAASNTTSCALTSVSVNDVIAVMVGWQTSANNLTSVTAGCVTGNFTTSSKLTDGLSHAAQLAYGVASSSGSCTVTATMGGGSQIVQLTVQDIAGVNPTTPVDNNQMSIKYDGNVSGTNSITSNSITTTQNGDYIFAAAYDAGGNVRTYTAGTVTLAYTIPSGAYNLTNGSESVTSEYGIQSSSGAIVADFTPSGGSFYDDGIIAFQPAPATATNVNIRGGTPAAITLINHAISSNAATSAKARSYTLGWSPAAGDTLAVAVCFSRVNAPDALSSVSDNKGNTYTLASAAAHNDTASGKSFCQWAWSVLSTGGSSFTLTMTLTSDENNTEFLVSEWSGVSGIKDAEAENTGTATSLDTGTLTTTNANDLVLGAFMDFAGSGSYTATGGFTKLDQDSIFIETEHQYQIVSSTGNWHPTATETSSSGWAAAGIALKRASGNVNFR